MNRNWWKNGTESKRGIQRCTDRQSKRRGRRLHLEWLEDRRLLAANLIIDAGWDLTPGEQLTVTEPQIVSRFA